MVMNTVFLSDYVLWVTVVVGYSRYDVMKAHSGLSVRGGLSCYLAASSVNLQMSKLKYFLSLLMDFHDSFIHLFARS